MVLYSSSWCFDEYNYHDSLQADLIERIGHSFEFPRVSELMASSWNFRAQELLSLSLKI